MQHSITSIKNSVKTETATISWIAHYSCWADQQQARASP